jgi:hypothetical protein
MLALLTATVALTISAAVAGAATLNTIDCERKADSDGTCTGTRDADKLLDEAGKFTEILGKGGNDTYVEYSGGTNKEDILHDTSSTSSDTYRIENKHFVSDPSDALRITDDGGPDDVLNLAPTGYDSNDYTASGIDENGDGRADDVFLDCIDPSSLACDDDIVIFDYCKRDPDSIELFKFDDGEFRLPKRNACELPNGAASNTGSLSAQEEQTTQAQGDGKQPSGVEGQESTNTSSSDWEKVK